jgi:flagellin-like hook-associated protein FlgL
MTKMDDKNQCKQWLAWINNRLKALDEIEGKLRQMRELAEQMQEGNFSRQQLAAVNQQFKLLEQEVNQLDEQSRNFITH